MAELVPPSIDSIRQAHKFVGEQYPETPLISFCGPGGGQIFLKCENLQPVGSFKLRGSVVAISQLSSEERKQGVWTASAGNMGLALAYVARRENVPCLVVVPDDAPAVKVNAILAEKADVVRVPFEVYQSIQNEKGWNWQGRPAPNLVKKGRLVHPFADPAMLAGNAALGMELFSQLSDIDLIVAPYGGGGLTCGLASAVRGLHSSTKVFASEVETGAPLSACLKSGKQVKVPYSGSFISGMGAPYVFDEMWPLAKDLVSSSVVVSLEEAAEAIRLLAVQNRLIVEGAAGTALAAAFKLTSKYRRIVVILSGGNIDSKNLCTILGGGIP